MKRFLIETPHKAEDCLKALDEELAKGPKVLEKFDYGCMAGDHTGYAIVDARPVKMQKRSSRVSVWAAPRSWKWGSLPRR